jgi:hypothetical protein
VIGLMWLLYGLLNVTRGASWLAVANGSPLLEPGAVNELYYAATTVFDPGCPVVFVTMNHQRTRGVAPSRPALSTLPPSSQKAARCYAAW